MGKNGKEGLGRALIKDRFSKNRHKKHVEDNSMLHTTEVNDGYDWGRLNLQSVTAESSLQEFLSTAELAEKEFTAEKLNVHYVKSAPSHVPPPTSQPDFSEPLTLPRRPLWLPGVSAEDQSAREREAFLEWRKHLNELQEKLGAALTPYERNLELWKQLWRTLEKSDLVLLLLDARNPLLFRSADLENYAVDQKCKCILLLNKADLITEYERKTWAEYFDKEGTQVVFFSAGKTIAKEKEDITEESNSLPEDSDSAISDIEEDIEDQDDKETEEGIEKHKKQEDQDIEDSDEVIDKFKKQVEELDEAVSQTADRLDRIQFELNKVLESIKLRIPIEPVNFSNNESDSTAVPIPLTNNETDSNAVPVQLANNETDSNAIHIQLANNETDSKANEKEIQESDEDNKINTESNMLKSTILTNSPHVLDREGLLEVLKSYKSQLKLKNPPHLTVGMIGYPNVGKSSTVNILMQTKKVSVSAMPGHTRHVQSLVLDEDLHILDCPGLVLPAYAVAPDLLLTAVLPIDQMRSCDAAACRLCELVSRRTMERQYGLLLPRHDPDEHALNYKEVLTAHAYNRGFMTAAGSADVSRSARILLKDAASGRLRWAVLPPGCSAELEAEEEEAAQRRKPTPMEARLVEGWSSRSAEIDRAFFGAGKGLAHVKGKPIAGLSGVQVAPTQDIAAKPWKREKKHANKNKREKLRRVYAHLDEH